MRPWSFPDVGEVALFITLLVGGYTMLVWWAAEKTAVNRMAAAADCPGPEPIARRVIDYRTGKVHCTYYWVKP